MGIRTGEASTAAEAEKGSIADVTVAVWIPATNLSVFVTSELTFIFIAPDVLAGEKEELAGLLNAQAPAAISANTNNTNLISVFSSSFYFSVPPNVHNWNDTSLDAKILCCWLDTIRAEVGINYSAF